METVILKNGAEEAKSGVAVVMMSLENLVQTNPIAAYELVEVCKNPAHKLFGNAGDILNGLGLLDSGHVHSSVKNVVLSAFEGEGLGMRLTFPIKTNKKQE